MRRLGWFAVLPLIGCPTSNETAETGDTEDVTVCAWDDDDELGKAGSLAAGTAAEGYLCPPGDQDWYALEVPASDDLVVIDLSIPDTPVSPIQLTYTLWDSGGVDVVATPGSSDSATAEVALSTVHQVTAGPHLLQIREVGNDAEDIRHPYALTFTTSADLDANEYNDDAGAATVPVGPVGAYISYRGDEDWYRVDVAANSILRVSLTMDVADLEPSFRIVDADEETLITASNPAGTREPTDLVVVHPLVAAGTYYVVVHDDDGTDHDLDTPYTLDLTVDADPDGNEPNDIPSQATLLPDRTCGAGWSAFAMESGYISSTGDVDWYELPLTGCDSGVLEARATFDAATPLPAGMQGELRLVREVSGTPCSVDQDCQALDIPCLEDLDCTYLGNTCLGSNQCAGAGVCLPSGNCGAKVVSEVARTGSEGSVLLTAPLFTEDIAWVAVADHQGDAWSTAHAYAVDLRVRQDPDTHEPNDVYTGGPPVDSNSGWHTPRAVTIPVHDCAPLPPIVDTADTGADPPPPVPDCCDSGTWVRGSVSFAYDQDWFRYAHPCPGMDCMVRIHFEFDAGPTDHYLRVFQGNGLWFDTLAGTTDIGTQPAISEAYGGLDAADECFYAYQGHSGGSFWYHLAIRDTVYVSAGDPTGGVWDASADQEYRVCVEKIANTCAEPPCQLYPNGCGVP